MWLSAGDKNSGCFHAVAKGRRAWNRLSVLEDAEGKAFFEEDQIANQISKYFDTIFTSDRSTGDMALTGSVVASAIKPSISDGENNRLCLIPDLKEIKYALFLIHPDKAPGPDVFSASFFHSNWDTIGATLVSEEQAFFRSGLMPETTNTTFIRLIPKSTSAKIVADYRSIALCNVSYKVITKILSLRLKPSLQHIILESQSAFVPAGPSLIMC